MESYMVPGLIAFIARRGDGPHIRAVTPDSTEWWASPGESEGFLKGPP